MEQETSLDKALTVLEAVAREGKASLTKLARQTGYPPSTVHRILGVLVRRGYLNQELPSKKYQLSLKILELSSRLQVGLDIIGVARPVMKKLMESTGETVNLVVFNNQEAIYVAQVSNTNSVLRMFTRVGARVPLYCSGVGKTYLASWPQDQVLAYFDSMEIKSYTENTIVQPHRLLRELEAIRRNGYAVDDQEMEMGVRCVAAAVEQDGEVVAALSVSGPSSRITPEATDRLGNQVAEAAGEIADALGYCERPSQSYAGRVGSS